MAEDSGGKEAGFNQSRRNLLIAGMAAVGAFFLGREATRPSPALEQAKMRWREYESNPDEFLKRYPNGTIEGLVAGPDGVNLRNIPSAQVGREGVVGYIKPNEPIGTALVFPNQQPNPDGPFLITKKGGDVVFLARRQLVEPDQQANINPPY